MIDSLVASRLPRIVTRCDINIFHFTWINLECSVEEFLNFMSCSFGIFSYFSGNTMNNEIPFPSPKIQGTEEFRRELTCCAFQPPLLSLVSYFLSSPTAHFQSVTSPSPIPRLGQLFLWVSHETGRILLLYLREVSRSISRNLLDLWPCKVLQVNTCLTKFLTFSLEKLPITFFRSL